MELFPTLKPLTKAQEKWGKYLYPTKAYFNRNGNICANCGESMGESLICPVCGRKHDKRAENNRRRATNTSFNICQAVGEFQVLRTFAVHTEYQRGKQASTSIWEVCQSWIDAKGKEIRVARGKSCFGADFIWWSDMEIRTGATGAYSYYGDLQYHYQDTYTYTKGSILPILKRNGLQSVVMLNKCKENPVVLMQKLLTDSKTETLVKTGNVHLVGERYIDRYWKQILLCIRHNYRIQDWTMWRDTIDMLQDEGKDIHNPVYVCPQDLTALHDRLLQKAENRRKREEYLEELAKQNNPKAQKMYQQAKGMYFGICITDEELTIEVLKSIEEFIKEGEFMHHCVNRCAYYSKENSLILSAKVNGKRMETIEIDLQRMTIVQSRGKCNMNTPYHDRIVDLMNANMGQIKKIRQQAMKVA
jgi:hypothetical protein